MTKARSRSAELSHQEVPQREGDLSVCVSVCVMTEAKEAFPGDPELLGCICEELG